MIHIKDYIELMVIKSGKPKQYTRSLGNLNRLLSEFDPNLTVSDFTEQKTEAFITFLKKKKYRPNTIKGYYQRLGYVLRRASQEYTINSGYLNCKVRGEAPQSVYLTMQEIQALINLNKLTKSAETVRDYFIIMCFTGLRISDVRRLSRNNVNGDFVNILTKKVNNKSLYRFTRMFVLFSTDGAINFLVVFHNKPAINISVNYAGLRK